MNSILLSLKKKVIYKFNRLLFEIIFFFNLKNRNGLPNNFFNFSNLKIVFKSECQTRIM